MIGAIAGDIIGSVYERNYELNNKKTTDFILFNEISQFTDDTVLTIAVADSILNNIDYGYNYQIYYKNYPHRGYGLRFREWASEINPEPYNSWGNGSAMRISPVGYAFNSLEEVLINSKAASIVTHNHPEGIKGAQATASCIFLARSGTEKKEIKDYISQKFGYDLNRTIKEIRPNYKFDESCQRTVPEAIIAFLESSDYENAIRLAISLGGDSDTLACITGGIAQAYYKEIPKEIIDETTSRLPEEFIKIISKFENRYGIIF